MTPEFGYIADPPNMVAHAICLRKGTVHFITGDFFTQINSLAHGAVGMTSAAGVVNRSATGVLIKMPKHIHQVMAVDVISDLFALVTENRVGLAADSAFHQIGQKTVQLGAGMVGARETAPLKQTVGMLK